PLSLSRRPLTKRSRPVSRVNSKRRVKSLRHCHHVGVAEHTANLRIVYARSATGMEVDPVIYLGNNVMCQVVCYPRCERAAWTSGKRTVYILPVRYVAGRTDESIDIDDWDTDHRAACRAMPLTFNQPPYYFRSVDLIAMHRSHKEQYRSRLFRP